MKIFLLVVLSLTVFYTQAQDLYYPKETITDPNFGTQSTAFGRKIEVGGAGGNKMIISASEDSSQSPQVGVVYLYEWNGTSWEFERSFRPENNTPSDQ
ncbi:MAG TPA: hypothetical protein DEG69_08795, partial [Flavobacteriaceae bacterium]|nr:hypothetical protein [Flavobacteriaceae bacterium]